MVAATNAVTWGGTWPNCTAVIAPVANANGGPVTITFTASDGTVTSAGQIFTLSVTAQPDPPTILTISSQNTNEDTAKAVAFTVGDPDGPLSCTATNLSYSSDNLTLVAGTGAVVWSGAWPNCVGTVSPVANAYGSANITFTISDGSLSFSQTFMLSVISVDDAPVIAAIPSQTTLADPVIRSGTISINSTQPVQGTN